MATTIWQGGAAAIAQVADTQIDGYDAASTYILTVGDKAVSQLATVDADTTAAALVVLWNLSTEPEVEEITASVVDDVITLTADTPGVPFIVISSKTGGAGTITAVEDTTPNSGPNDLAVATNWSEGQIPGENQEDDIVFENSTVSCLYNLDGIGVNGIGAFTSKSTFTGIVGLPRNNPLGYVEYRPASLELGAAVTDITVGQGSGNGSPCIKLATGNLAADLAVNVSKTALSATTGVPAFLLTTGTQAADITTVTINRGTVGIGYYAGETAVVQSLKIGYIASQQSDATVNVGSGVTLTAVTVSGGVNESLADVASLLQTGGTMAIQGAAALAVGNINKGTLFYNSDATLGEVTVDADAVLDFRQDGRSRDVDAATIYSECAVYDPNGTVTWTTGIDLVRCGLRDVTLDLGEHFTLNMGTI